IVISRMSLVNNAPRRASVTAFFRLICFHLLWPAMLATYLVSTIRVEHILEPHPAAIEVQIHEARRPIAILQDDELGRSLHAVAGIVHLLAVNAEDHVGVLLDGAKMPEIVE